MTYKNKHVRQILIKVNCNTINNYTILSLAKSITENETKEDFCSALYAIDIMIGELLIAPVIKGDYPYDRNTEILGLTEKGKHFYQSFKEDFFWNEVQRRTSILGSASLPVLASCCDYLKKHPNTTNTWYPLNI